MQIALLLKLRAGRAHRRCWWFAPMNIRYNSVARRAARSRPTRRCDWPSQASCPIPGGAPRRAARSGVPTKTKCRTFPAPCRGNRSADIGTHTHNARAMASTPTQPASREVLFTTLSGLGHPPACRQMRGPHHRQVWPGARTGAASRGRNRSITARAAGIRPPLEPVFFELMAVDVKWNDTANFMPERAVRGCFEDKSWVL